MASFTSKAIKDSFLELIEEHPLSEITINDIVKRIGINRNTFYYHYADLPTLIEEIFEEDAELFIKKYPHVGSIVECFDAMAEYTANRKRMIMHIYRSVNREVFEHNMMKLSSYFISNYVDSVITDINISERDKKTIVTYYKSVCFGVVMQWLDLEMSEDYANEIRRIFRLKKDFAVEIATLLQNQV